MNRFRENAKDYEPIVVLKRNKTKASSISRCKIFYRTT